MTVKHTVKLTGNFERNLEGLETFLVKAEAPHAFDALLDELTDTVIPNLESFPGMGRLFLERPARSVEVANGLARLAKQLGSLAKDGEVREYVMTHYLLLYARIKGTVYLLSIRHQRQLSFDFEALWQNQSSRGQQILAMSRKAP
ncbi:MAG: type II toxin-antitoxin system RelE/ParE family toxin [Betaproteobacteria bacterium]|nr:type II toxin-antitoxin system RelE/ParE family toxin [Betaproteobacteria bacterium]MDE2122159.1 type II toxin-antitoxin system RelE/ParE family toxin [Betaproteobacteria bacterium]MDE2185623.1 type II toxin-antitoxin system RelE/ParE family toxin [Betaproteobacteria bacterium]MDE2323809.1 type II toxin-antitoxin system RelE/ParE family toxin [Betaproteobacteria bacterium]